MVVVASPQPNELEQKKRKQTLERAKANHLSKQLQMRLQYAKLKVEHGWQRQNLNEVENLYFHHSHLKNVSLRQHQASARHSQQQQQRPLNQTYVGPYSPSVLTVQQNVNVPIEVPDRTVVSSPSTANVNSTDPSTVLHVPASCPSPSELVPAADVQPSSQQQQQQQQQQQPASSPVPVPAASLPTTTSSSATVTALASVLTNRPPSAIDLSDPNILARLAQLQAQLHSQMSMSIPTSVPSSQAQSQSSSHIHNQTQSNLPTTTTTILPPSTSPSLPITLPGTFSQPAFTFPWGPQPFSAGAAFYPIPIPIPAPSPSASTSQPPVSSSLTTAFATTPAPATSVAASTAPTLPTTTPTPTLPIAPTALTYDSFWSTHASSTGPTRALYRTQTGFSASATPGGNVAMLTPGGHAAVMTAEGVYVGGGSGKSG